MNFPGFVYQHLPQNAAWQKVKLVAFLVLLTLWLAALGWLWFKLDREQTAHTKTKADWAKSEAMWEKSRANTESAIRKLESDYRTLEQLKQKERANVDREWQNRVSAQAKRVAAVSAERDKLRKQIQQRQSQLGTGRNNNSASAAIKPGTTCPTNGEVSRLLDLILEIDGLAEEAIGAAVRESDRLGALQLYVERVCLGANSGITTK